jgi:hypothetical protein
VLSPLMGGDTNYDTWVNGTDFARLAANFGKSGLTWQQGDFTGDGVVNGTDFALLASNFGMGPGGPSNLSAADQAALEAFAQGHGLPVPEPTAAGALAAVSLTLLMRCRRQPS